ncbi:MAG: hypothetical protein KAJ19_14465, partial [Gammaproteobacteria bacterium]|nr:hypothetical protein [Gammaproteobacteria bacterium]
MFLLYTTKNKGHDHVAYQRADETGVTSKANGHSHEIIVEEVPAPIGDLSPAELAAVSIEADIPLETRVVVAPGGKDNHTHELTDILITPDPEEIEADKGTDGEVIAESRGLWQFAKGKEEDLRKSGYESEDFYFGKQWDPKEKKRLENAKRAAL